jgi:hypothetical protein
VQLSRIALDHILEPDQMERARKCQETCNTIKSNKYAIIDKQIHVTTTEMVVPQASHETQDYMNISESQILNVIKLGKTSPC